MNNTTNNMFEMASQFKFRYPWKGMITTEDLWDLNEGQLDAVYQSLSKELKACQEGDSLFSTKLANLFNKKLTVKIDIVKYIFNCKQQATEFYRMEVERAAKKQHILEVLAAKQENTLQNMSEEDLKKMLDDLG